VKAFRFRLKSLLELNTRRREMAARTAGLEQARLRAIDDELNGLAGDRSHEGVGLTRAGAHPTAGMLQQLDRRLDALDQEIRRTTVNRRAQNDQVEKCRQELIVRRQEEEKLERLRQRRLESWRIAQRRLEQAELDEVASQRRLRRCA